MRRMVIVPIGIPCKLGELPPGLFIGTIEPFGIGVKDEYDGKGYNESGEYWCSKELVMPAEMRIEDDE